jgi:arabinofuranosyltransferase
VDFLKKLLARDTVQKEQPLATDAGPDLPFDKQRLLLPIATAVFLILCVRSAWVGDDAYITLRTVDNFVNGYGLTWNISERVQAYTHPLWMFVLSAIYFVTREAYYSTVGLSLILSTCTAVLVGLLARDVRVGAIAILVLGMSKAFVDYSTSGLENPLTHLVPK